MIVLSAIIMLLCLYCARDIAIFFVGKETQQLHKLFPRIISQNIGLLALVISAAHICELNIALGTQGYI